MSKRAKRGVVVAKRSGMVVSTHHRRPSLHPQTHPRVRPLFVVYGLPGLAVVLAVGLAITMQSYKSDLRHERQITQKQLQTTVGSQDGLGNPTELQKASNRLIAGAKDGTYSVADKDLAQAYLARADVEYNAAKYQSAVSDYKQAARLDRSLQQAAAYGEFLSRYRLGDRKTLIPLLQILQAPLKDSHEMGAQDQWARYESYIVGLRDGKDLEL